MNSAKKITVLFVALLISGCASNPITITYKPDVYGVPTPIVNGVAFPMTDDERRAIAQKFVDAYCPA